MFEDAAFLRFDTHMVICIFCMLSLFLNETSAWN